ncbi:uncharacterized protein [Hetaerina americana]|uniref:uncharacterized protein n=1 Tax=Hetaerina americana TaxID=62018 RepID=UPI003A7F2386
MTTKLSDDSNNHYIQLSNVKNGDIFTHSVCLLKGQINAEDRRCTGGKILLHQAKDNLKEVLVASEWEVTDWGEFRCLFSFKSGPNQIRLLWKCPTCGYDAQLTIQLYYEERNTSYKVLPLWIVCQDSEEESKENILEENLERVYLMALLAQCVTSECLWDKGFGRSSIFCLEPKVAVFKSQLTSCNALSMNHEALWQYLARELMSSHLASQQTKYLAFLSCTRYEMPVDDAASKKRAGRIKGHVALGAGGLALLGTASIHTWPRSLPDVLPHFLDSTPVDTKKYFDDSCRRGTYGGCFATAVGSVCHELGHTFDLGHTQNGIMGRGFHHIQKIFILPQHNEDTAVKRSCSEKLVLNNISLEFKKQNSSTSSTAHLNTDINISWSQPKKEFSSSSFSQMKKIKEKQQFLAGPSSKKPSKNEEFPFWSNGCAAILAYHRWFNDFPVQTNNPEMITFNKQMRCISSAAGLRVVQIRNDSNGGAVMSSWQFLGPRGRSQFLIPSAFSFPKPNSQAILSVVAEDSVGNILKDKF